MISRISSLLMLLASTLHQAYSFPIAQQTQYSSSKWRVGTTDIHRVPKTRISLIDISKASTDMLSTVAFNESPNLETRLFEQEFFSGMAHLTSDIATLIARGTAILRFTMVVGRLFAMGADYVPDEMIQPEELVFQICMLIISLTGFIHSISPMVLASFHGKETSMKDGRTFQVLFRKAGVTWTQYRALSVCAFEWVTVTPGHVITSEEGLSNDENDDHSVYWLYSGQVRMESKGKLVNQVARHRAPRLKDVAARGLGLFGEMRLAESMHNHNNNNQGDDDQSTYPKITVRAGDGGATLLRINTQKLKHMMAHDSHLADSIRRLLFSSMQDKLNALIAA